MFETDWREFYGDVKEPIPPHAPPPRGKDVVLRLCVDASHADDKLKRCSRKSYFILVNKAPIAWLSRSKRLLELASLARSLSR